MVAASKSLSFARFVEIAHVVIGLFGHFVSVKAELLERMRIGAARPLGIAAAPVRHRGTDFFRRINAQFRMDVGHYRGGVVDDAVIVDMRSRDCQAATE